MQNRIATTALSLAMLLGPVGPGARELSARDLADVARDFAPVLHQDTASDQDYITRFDFDGDWNGGNNWENQPRHPLAAWVYWAGVETGTHVFLTYAWFHPRDYNKWQRPGNLIGRSGAHENDLEGALLVLEKGEGDGLQPVVLETIFHSTFKKYSLDAGYRARAGTGLEDLRVRFEQERHPILEMESHGHGASAWDGEGFPGGDGVVYRPGAVAEVPESDDDRDVSYRLVDIESTLWSHRFETGEGQAYAKTDRFGGEEFGYAFRGYDYGHHKANAPWGWTDEHTPLPRGTIFLDPARLVAAHFVTPEGYSREYLPNPFTDRRWGQFSRWPRSTTVSAAASSSGLLGN